MYAFTPYLEALAGGVLIGLASILLLQSHGKIAGISGILGRVPSASQEDRPWRLSFLAGLVGTGALLAFVFGDPSEALTAGELPRLALAAIFVGLGTQMANGCTSGHGICGLSRLSRRSLAAVITFMAAGMLTVAVAGTP